MAPPDRPDHGPHAMVDVVRWVIQTLIKMAQVKDWGEIRITVQDGQVMFVHEARSYRHRLPQDSQGPAVAEVVRQVVGVR